VHALAPGSYLAITHPTADFNAGAIAEAVAAAEHSGISLVPRSHAQTGAFFTGLEMVEPGVVPVLAWRPDDGQPADPHGACYYVGIGCKPLPADTADHRALAACGPSAAKSPRNRNGSTPIIDSGAALLDAPACRDGRHIGGSACVLPDLLHHAARCRQRSPRRPSTRGT
jgi:S-adenosyl methyltransferase